jgi:hypothetical protein
MFFVKACPIPSFTDAEGESAISDIFMRKPKLPFVDADGDQTLDD